MLAEIWMSLLLTKHFMQHGHAIVSIHVGRYCCVYNIFPTGGGGGTRLKYGCRCLLPKFQTLTTSGDSILKNHTLSGDSILTEHTLSGNSIMKKTILLLWIVRDV